MWREVELSWDFDMENCHKSYHFKDRDGDTWIILKLLKEIHKRICAEYNKDRIRFSDGTLNLWVLTAEIGQVNEKHVPKNAVTEDTARLKCETTGQVQQRTYRLHTKTLREESALIRLIQWRYSPTGPWPTERPPPVSEASANFCGWRGVTWSAQRIPTDRYLFYSSSSSVDLTRLSAPRSRPTATQKIW